MWSWLQTRSLAHLAQTYVSQDQSHRDVSGSRPILVQKWLYVLKPYVSASSCVFSPINPWLILSCHSPHTSPCVGNCWDQHSYNEEDFATRRILLPWYHGSPSLTSSGVPDLSHNTYQGADQGNCEDSGAQGKLVSWAVFTYMVLFDDKHKVSVIVSPVHSSDCCYLHFSFFFVPEHPTCPFSPCQIVTRPECYTSTCCVQGEPSTAAAETLFWNHETHCCNAGKLQMQLFSCQVCQMILASG